MPESLTRIGAKAFEGCYALKSLTIPAGVRAVGARAFAHDNSLTLTFSGDAPSFDPAAFEYGMNINAVYHSAANGWTELAGERFGASSLMWSSDGVPTQIAPIEDSPKDASLPLEPEITANCSHQDIASNYARTITSYLLNNEDGTFTRVEYSNYKIHVEVYDSSYRLIWKQQLERELPLWGGFYSGKNYNFLVFGQNNSNEDDNCEVVRVVRYSKNWHRLDSASVYGCNTTEPFRAGSLRMVEWGDYLYIHTAHQRYTTPDGLRHQSDMNLQLLIPEMKLVGGDGSCSHSFNQFIIEDSGAIVRLNLGDAKPRAVVINSTSVLKIPGEKGDNYTGTSVGAFLASEKNYLTAGVTLVNWQTNQYGKVKNLFLGVTDKETHSTTLRKITDYGENMGITRPHMVKVGDDRFLLLWVEYSGEVAWDGVSAARQLRYVFLDGDGNSVSQIYTSPRVLSDCVPILTGNRVLWYVTDNALPLFCWIDLDAPEKVHTNGPEVLPERITVTPQTLTLTPGQTVQLTASVEPAGADTQLIWTSSDPSVVTVDQNGRVTGVSAEKDKTLTANISVRHAYGGPYAFCYIFMKYDPEGRFEDVPGDADLICSNWARADVTRAWELIKDRIPYSYNWAGTNTHGEAASIIGKDLTQPITRAEFATLVSAAYDYILGDTAVNDGYNAGGNTLGDDGNSRLELLMPTDGQLGFTDVWFDPATGKDCGWVQQNDPDTYRRIMSAYMPNTGWKAHEYIDGIMAACNMGLMNGNSETTFGPGKNLTREQAATVLMRIAERYSNWQYRKDPNQSAAFPAWTEANPYTDTISGWALDGILRSRAAGIMLGTSDTTFSAKADFTREQALVTLMRMIEWCKPWYQELTTQQLADNAVRRAANPNMW